MNSLIQQGITDSLREYVQILLDICLYSLKSLISICLNQVENLLKKSIRLLIL